MQQHDSNLHRTQRRRHRASTAQSAGYDRSKAPGTWQRLCTLLAVALLAIAGSMSHASAADTLTFGVVPQQAASKLARLWAPITDYLGAATGLDIRFATAPDIPTFERRLARGEYDVAYMNPYHFVVFNQSPGYRALAHARGKKIRGIVVVRKDNPIADLQALDGERLAFPAPAAFAASILPRAKLAALAIKHEPVYVSSHDSVYRAVAQGLFPAGGGVIRTFNNVEPAVREQLRILWTTDGYTPHAIAAHPSLDDQTRQQLTRALVDMAQDESGRSLLQAIRLKGFEAANDAAWDDVRRLQIDLPGQL
jgi:phosphonate transport system substrate-binding protein